MHLFFLLNDFILDIDPSRMMHPLEADRFAALSVDYIAQLGKEMFAEDPQAHRRNPERVRRLCYLINLKQPRVNAAQFFVSGPGIAGVEAEFKSVNDADLGALYQQQMAGRLNARVVDQEVWHRMAA